jgi:uncharacterized membrane protein
VTPQLRIGDAERERAQAALNDHYAAGRLDHDEYSERLDRIWAARTQADLAPVFADLPRPATPWPAARPRPASRRTGPRMPLPLLVLLVVLATVAVVSNLPLILIGLAVWFFFLRGGCGSHGRWGGRSPG